MDNTYDISKILMTPLLIESKINAIVESGYNRVTSELGCDNVFLIVDDNIFELYKDKFNIDSKVKFAVPSGEKYKNLQTAEKIAAAMLEAGCDRKTKIVALGGGVVGDTAGVVAANYMRGVEWVSVPTTLLAMVDSGIGGKTAVNIGTFKNMFGAFWMPKKVIICTDFLKTLPDVEWLSGIGEVVKTAVLEPNLWKFIYSNRNLLMNKDMNFIKQAVESCAKFKEKVTQIDFKENGLRRILNLGHTIGHALESVDGYKLTHGEYVLWGIKHETNLFEDMIEAAFLKQIRDLLDIVLSGRSDPHVKHNKTAIDKATQKDKKNEGGKVAYVVPIKTGVIEVVSI